MDVSDITKKHSIVKFETVTPEKTFEKETNRTSRIPPEENFESGSKLLFIA
jgi:hypothetical protein